MNCQKMVMTGFWEGEVDAFHYTALESKFAIFGTSGFSRLLNSGANVCFPWIVILFNFTSNFSHLRISQSNFIHPWQFSEIRIITLFDLQLAFSVFCKKKTQFSNNKIISGAFTFRS